MKNSKAIIMALVLVIIILLCTNISQFTKNSSKAEENKGKTTVSQSESKKTGVITQNPVVEKDNTSSGKDWLNNLMTTNPLDAFDIKREKIYSVTFQDHLNDVPKNAWNLGKGANSRVKGWVEWNGGMADIYFAAENGINGELCCESMFEGCENLEEIHFNGAFHTDKADSMGRMFYGCVSLETVDIETLNTSNVTTMAEMFRECTALKSINTRNMDTGKVTSMYCMFSTCVALKNLDLRTFDTSKVTNMGFMFSACRSLETVDVTSFDTSKVSNMEGMFRWCESLQSVDLSGWDLGRVKNYSSFMDPGTYYNGKPWENLFN